MKLGGPEVGGERQGFFSGARDRLRELSQFPQGGPTEVQRQEAERQAKQAAVQAEYDRSQTPEAIQDREDKIQNMIDSFNRYANNNGGPKRSNEEVDSFLKSTNADIRNTELGAEAWSRWQEQRARAAVEAATDNVVSIDDYRNKKETDEEGVA
jgi:hypothetical protein